MTSGAIYYGLGALTLGPLCFVVGYVLGDLKRIERRRAAVDEHGPRLRVIEAGHVYQATATLRKAKREGKP